MWSRVPDGSSGVASAIGTLRAMDSSVRGEGQWRCHGRGPEYGVSPRLGEKGTPGAGAGHRDRGIPARGGRKSSEVVSASHTVYPRVRGRKRVRVHGPRRVYPRARGGDAVRFFGMPLRPGSSSRAGVVPNIAATSAGRRSIHPRAGSCPPRTLVEPLSPRFILVSRSRRNYSFFHIANIDPHVIPVLVMKVTVATCVSGLGLQSLSGNSSTLSLIHMQKTVEGISAP